VVQTKRTPSIFGKVAYDNNFNDLRVRVSGSVYNNSNIQRNTLFAGDRTGSHYFGIMEPAKIGGLPISIGTSPSDPTKNSGPNFTSGRLDPGVSNRVTAISFSPFVKFHGLEIFASYDIINGAVYGDTLRDARGTLNWENRSASQVLVEGAFRFLKNEQMYVAARFIKATAQPSGLKYSSADTGKTAGAQAEVNVDRIAFSAGWFPTKNLLLKVEYMVQNFKDFPFTDYRYEGQVKGFMVQAAIGF
jgi:hypothetical protein